MGHIETWLIRKRVRDEKHEMAAFFAQIASDQHPRGWVPAELQSWARELIGGLLDGQKIDPSKFEKFIIDKGACCELQLDKKTGCIVPIGEAAIFDNLRELIRTCPFPFARCLTCKKIYAPNSGRQTKYCSKTCADIAIYPWKRRYMKKYMKARRKIRAV